MKKVLVGIALGLALGVMLLAPSAKVPGEGPSLMDAAVAPAASRAPASVKAAAVNALGVAALAVAPKAKAAVPGNPAPSVDSQALVDRIQTLNACYASNTCNYPHTDPRSYGFAVGKDLEAAINNLAVQARAEGWKSEELATLSREELKNEDGYVQEAALALMATQDPSPENLDSVLNDVIGGIDAQLMQAALQELRRYDSDSDHDKIANALSAAMVSGSTFVGKQIASSISPFLYPRSIPVYEGALSGLPDGSVIKTDLGRSLAMVTQ